MPFFGLKRLHFLFLDVMLLTIFFYFVHLSLDLFVSRLVTFNPINEFLTKRNFTFHVLDYLGVNVHLIFHIGQLLILIPGFLLDVFHARDHLS